MKFIFLSVFLFVVAASASASASAQQDNGVEVNAPAGLTGDEVTRTFGHTVTIARRPPRPKPGWGKWRIRPPFPTLYPIRPTIHPLQQSFLKTFDRAAPAGFTWGENKQQIESKGIAVRDCSEHKLDLHCYTDSAPKVKGHNNIFKEYKLIFIEELGLQGVVLFTDDYTNDPYGHLGKKIYDLFKKRLISMYGQPELSDEYTGKALYDEPDKFYQCLEHVKCGNWLSYWGFEGAGAIKMKIRGTGDISIFYVSEKFFPKELPHSNTGN